jgi:hypothetical protein
MKKAFEVLDTYLQDIGEPELTDHQYHWLKIAMEDFANQKTSALLEIVNELVNAGQEALDYKDGSGRPILQEAIWKAQELVSKATV